MVATDLIRTARFGAAESEQLRALDLREVEARLTRAKEAFLTHDQHLLSIDANERSMTGALARHIRDQFPTWDVDCEYNRHVGKVKRLVLEKNSFPGDIVVPDIIVHRRGVSENLLVIEAKKDSNCGDADRKRLFAFLHRPEYEYSFGALFRFITGSEPSIHIELTGKGGQ